MTDMRDNAGTGGPADDRIRAAVALHEHLLVQAGDLKAEGVVVEHRDFLVYLRWPADEIVLRCFCSPNSYDVMVIDRGDALRGQSRFRSDRVRIERLLEWLARFRALVQWQGRQAIALAEWFGWSAIFEPPPPTGLGRLVRLVGQGYELDLALSDGDLVTLEHRGKSSTVHLRPDGWVSNGHHGLWIDPEDDAGFDKFTQEVNANAKPKRILRRLSRAR
jgi:hypothetical protein